MPAVDFGRGSSVHHGVSFWIFLDPHITQIQSFLMNGNLWIGDDWGFRSILQDKDAWGPLFNKTSRPRDDDETVESLWSDWDIPRRMMQADGSEYAMLMRMLSLWILWLGHKLLVVVFF